MRGLFGILGLILVVAVVGLLAKKQLSSVNSLKVPELASPADEAKPASTVQGQSTQIQQQFKAAAEAAVQQARPVADDK